MKNSTFEAATVSAGDWIITFNFLGSISGCELFIFHSTHYIQPYLSCLHPHQLHLYVSLWSKDTRPRAMDFVAASRAHDPKSKLLTLPAELGNIIWTAVFTSADPSGTRISHGTRSPFILQVSRQTRAEYYRLFFSLNISSSSPLFVQQIHAAPRRRSPLPIRSARDNFELIEKVKFTLMHMLEIEFNFSTTSTFQVASGTLEFRTLIIFAKHNCLFYLCLRTRLNDSGLLKQTNEV